MVFNMSANWYIRQSGKVRGPISTSELKREITEGMIQREDEFSADQKEWHSILSWDKWSEKPVHEIVEELTLGAANSDSTPPAQKQFVESSNHSNKSSSPNRFVQFIIFVCGMVFLPRVLWYLSGSDKPYPGFLPWEKKTQVSPFKQLSPEKNSTTNDSTTR